MERKYTKQHLNTFFKGFKSLSNPYSIEKVHQLIHNPDAKATHRVSQPFIHVKFIIMTSAFIILTSLFLVWLNPMQPEETGTLSTVDPVPKADLSFENNPLQKDKIKGMGMPAMREDSLPEKGKRAKNHNSLREPHHERGFLSQNIEASDIDNCAWPLDTLLDKNSLYVYLSNEELEDLGIHIVEPTGRRFYYFTVDGNNSSSSCFNVPCNSDTMQATPFYIEEVTDTLCTTERWGSPFYNKVDTLIPVLAKEFTYKNRIFWFSPGDSIFKVLPKRYRNLENTYHNLKCLKKENPERSFVDHWDINRNIVLDEINSLELNKTELEDIGIKFDENRIEMSDPSGNYYYRFDKWGKETRNGKGDTINKYPVLFPTLITDIKGLAQQKYGSSFRNEPGNTYSDNFDLLIPVLMPLSEYIENRKFELVFWYYPTDEFISALPERIRKHLKPELKALQDETVVKKVASCTYFEACKSTLHLDRFRLYPNPATFAVTLEFYTNEPLRGSISLVNISGGMVRNVIPETDFATGKNSYNLDLNGIAPGIYLISLNTNKGFKTQRLIVSH